MSRWLVGLGLMAVLGVVTPNVAQARSAAPRAQSLQFCLLESVKGHLLPPRCEVLEVRPTPTLTTLIEYRLDFIPEMFKAAERL